MAWDAPCSGKLCFEATVEIMRRFNRLFSESLIACQHQHLQCFALRKITLGNLAYFPGSMNQASLTDIFVFHDKCHPAA